MAKITFHGHSDDIVELVGDIGPDDNDALIAGHGRRGGEEFSVDRDDSWVGVIEAPDGDIAMIFVDYRHNGTWTVSLGIWDEDHELPGWPTTSERHPDFPRYSQALTLDVPDGTIVRPYIRGE